MFQGQKPAFGQPATAGGSFFGNTQPSPFGQSFVKPQTSGFGQASTFGSPGMFGAANQSAGPFGTAAQAPGFGSAVATTQSGFGGFAQPQQQPTNLFGAPQQANPNTSIFGASNPGFNTAAKPAFGVFGQTQQQQQQQPSSFFGTAQQQQQPAGGGLFGQNPSTSGGGLFGNTAPAFGAQQQQQPGANGTAVAKYQPFIGTDTLMKGGTANNVNTKLHCITSMKEYESKSLEELRMEDYLENRKGPQAGFGPPAGNTSLFGQQQPIQSTGLFGQTTENKGLFSTNQNTISGFGQPSTLLNAANQQTSLFSKPFTSTATTTTASAFGGFGATTTPGFGAKPFGQQQTTGLFGQPATSVASAFGQPAQPGGFFGAPNQSAPLFGAPAPDNKSAFGVQQAAAPGFGNTFGAATNTNAPQNNSLFGPKPQTNFNLFGQQQQQPATMGGFGTMGQTQQAGGLFNAAAKPPTSSFGGFGTQPTTALGGGGLLGNTNSSFFGSNANKPGGLFGNTTGQAGGLFGGGSSFGATSNLGGFGQSTLGGGTLQMGGATGLPASSISVHDQIIALSTSPYGDPSIFNSLKNNGFTEDSLKSTNPSVLKNVLETTANQYKISSKSGPVKLIPIGDVLSKKALFDGLEEYDSTIDESFKFTPNPRRLVISKNKTPLSNNKENVQMNIESRAAAVTDLQDRSPRNIQTYNVTPEATSEAFNYTSGGAGTTNRRESWLKSNAFDKVKQTNRISDIGSAGHDNTILQFSNDKLNKQSADLSDMLPRTRRNLNDSSHGLDTSAVLQQNTTVSDSVGGSSKKSSKERLSTSHLEGTVDSQGSADHERHSSPSRFTAHLSNDSLLSTQSVLNESMLATDVAGGTFEPHPTGIVLNRPGYYTIPSLDELLSYLKEDDTCIVPNFTVGREGYGNVYFNEEMDVAGINIDEIVFFRNKEVIVYPDDNNKPPEGFGLNRKAQITLDQVWPYDKTIHQPIKDAQRIVAMNYEAKLRNVCDKYNTRFVEYRPETGSWVFKVNHFSKYGLSDSDEEEDIVAKKAKLQLQAGALSNNNAVETGAIPKTNILASLSKRSTMPLEQIPSDLFSDFNAEMDFTNENIIDLNRKSYFSTSPTTDLATNLGTDSHKLQLMKASFFNEDDFDGRSTISDYGMGRDMHDQIVPTQSLMRKMRDSDNNSISSKLHDFVGLESIPAESIASQSSLQQIAQHEKTNKDRDVDPLARNIYVKPKVASIAISNVTLPMDQSFIMNKLRGKCLSDVAFMNGRKFRAGWGSKNMLLVLSTQNNSRAIMKNPDLEMVTDFSKHFNSRDCDDTSPTIIQELQITSHRMSEQNFANTIVKHLEIELEYAMGDGDECCPFMKSGGDTYSLEEHFTEANSRQNMGNFEEYSTSVWALCLALWGDREELIKQETNNHYTVVCRRDLFSQWLEDNTKPSTKYNADDKLNYLTHLLNLLISHKITDACELAFQNDDLNLSMLLAQISGGPAIRQLITHQLSSWQDVEADKFISQDRLKIFMLIAGIPVLSSTHGVINIYENLDWIKLLALHVWYLSSPTASITDSLLNYDKSYESENIMANPPVPPYFGSSGAEPDVKDMRYHLLKLFSRKSHPLEPLLNPSTHTVDPMDFRLSWLVLQTLESLGYTHCSGLSEAQIHTSFAIQLETHGLWHWSIFVLQHIKTKNQREITIQDYLYKYVTMSTEADYLEKENFVIDKLGISRKWIYWAKAVRAGAMNDHHAQVTFLLKAKQWPLAHEILMQHIVPDAIINDILYAKKFLDEFEDHSKIPDWSIQGQIILDYIELNEKIELLKRLPEHDVERNWEALKPQISDLCSRISLFKCPTAKHRLCQSEIAQKLACLVRGVLLKGDVDPCLVIKLALEKLPLPQEYAQKELRVLLDRFVVEFLRQNMEC